MDDCRFFPEKAIASLLADSHLCSVVLRFAYTRGEKCEQKQIDHKQTIFRLYRGPVFPSVLAHRVLQLRSTGSTAAEVRSSVQEHPVHLPSRQQSWLTHRVKLHSKNSESGPIGACPKFRQGPVFIHYSNGDSLVNL